LTSTEIRKDPLRVANLLRGQKNHRGIDAAKTKVTASASLLAVALGLDFSHRFM